MKTLIIYFIIGGVSAIIDLILFIFLVQLSTFNWFYAGIVAFCIATSINYFLSIRFAFESGIRFKNKSREFLVIFIVSTVGLIINQLSLYVCIELMSIILPLSKIIASASTFFWNFFLRKNYVFYKAL